VPPTLRGRLVLAAGGSIVAALLLFGVASVVLVNHQLRSSLDSALRQRALQVSELAVSTPAVLNEPGALEGTVSGRQIVVEVLGPDGRLLSRSLALGASLLPEDRLARQAIDAGRTGFENVSVNGHEFRMYAAPIAQAGGVAAGGAVLVASDTTDISYTVGHLEFVLTLAGIGAAVVGVLAAAALTRRGLGPLRRLAGAAGEIERTADPAQRLPAPAAADEIGRLTGVLNRMLASLEQARTSERRFLADASHELRTPVTTLLGNAEYAARHGADPEVLAELCRDAARLARLVDDLLVLERAGVAAQERMPVELDELARDAICAHDGQVRAARIEPVVVEAEEAGLRRVLDNLIENALVHGPTDGTVEVTLLRREGRALLTVRDQGAGPDPASRERLFERFWRGPDASDRPGSGLGLSIAAAIVERHGGWIAVDGSAFTVDLPARG
jgi:signal transduction histidine kinase